MSTPMIGANSKGIASSALIALIIKALGAVCAYGMFAILARLLAPQEYGRFAYGLNFAIIFATLTGLGFSVGVLRFIPKYRSEGNEQAVKGLALTGLRLSFLVPVCCGIVIFILGQFQSFESLVFIICALTLSVAICVGDYTTSLLRSLGNTIVSMLPRDVLWRLGTPFVLMILILLGFSIAAPLAIMIAALVLFALNGWQIWTALKLLPNVTEKFDRREIQPSLTPLWIASLIYSLIQQFDVVIVGTFINGTEAGSYFAAQKTAQLLSLVLIAGGLVGAPHMSALFHSNKISELQKLCNKLALAIFTLTFLGFIILCFLGEHLLAIFDQSFVSAYPILIVLALATLVDALAGPTAYLMQMTNLEKPYVWIMAICYAFVVCAQIALIPIYGALGAAIASASGTIIWNLISIYWLRKKINLDPSLLGVVWSPRIGLTNGKEQS